MQQRLQVEILISFCLSVFHTQHGAITSNPYMHHQKRVPGTSIYTFINKSQCSQYLDRPDLSSIGHPVPNLADVQRIIVTFAPCVLVPVAGILPCLRESSIIPDVAMVWEAVVDVTEFLFLDILFDRIEGIGDRDLKGQRIYHS